MDSLNDLIHKEKNQKKYNKATGQIDNLKKYTQSDNLTSPKTGKQPTADKQIRREANFIKNIHIDETLERLKSIGLVTDAKYDAWWCGVMHTLGVSFVTAQADLALNNGKKPDALFHFLINKAMNKANDPHLPRF